MVLWLHNRIEVLFPLNNQNFTYATAITRVGRQFVKCLQDIVSKFEMRYTLLR